MEGQSKYNPKAIHKRTKLKWRLLALGKMPRSLWGHGMNQVKIWQLSKVCLAGLGFLTVKERTS